MTMSDRRDSSGQAIVEFALAIIVFLMLLMAIFDLGRGIYTFNGVSQAAREVARAATVHQNINPPGVYSPEATQVVNTQKALVPGLVVDNPKCVASTSANDSAGATGRRCDEGEYIVVTAHSSYTPVSLLGILGTINLQAKSRVQIPLSQNR
jgi:Flp pilus assembly protein TadG